MAKKIKVEPEYLLKYATHDKNLWSCLVDADVENDYYGLGLISSVEVNEYGAYIKVVFSDGKERKYNFNAFEEGILYDLEVAAESCLLLVLRAQKIEEEIAERKNKKKEKGFNKIKKALDKYNIKSLWYMIHIDSLESVIDKGIYCRNLAESEGLNIVDISDGRVQARRRRYHQYVNLYFADNTPMLYVSLPKNSDRIVLLELDPLKAIKDKLLFTDGNAASNDTIEYNDLGSLDKLNWSIIKSRAGAFSGDYKRIRSAEFLIEKHVDAGAIKCIYVQSSNAKKISQLMLKRLNKSNIMVKQCLTLQGVR